MEAPPSEADLLRRRTQIAKSIAIENGIAQMSAYLRSYFDQKRIVHQCDAVVVMGLLAEEIEADTYRMEETMKRRVATSGGLIPPSTVSVQAPADSHADGAEATEREQLVELKRLELEIEQERAFLVQALKERSELTRQLAVFSALNRQSPQ